MGVRQKGPDPPKSQTKFEAADALPVPKNLRASVAGESRMPLTGQPLAASVASGRRKSSVPRQSLARLSVSPEPTPPINNRSDRTSHPRVLFTPEAPTGGAKLGLSRRRRTYHPPSSVEATSGIEFTYSIPSEIDKILKDAWPLRRKHTKSGDDDDEAIDDDDLDGYETADAEDDERNEGEAGTEPWIDREGEARQEDQDHKAVKYTTRNGAASTVEKLQEEGRGNPQDLSSVANADKLPSAFGFFPSCKTASHTADDEIIDASGISGRGKSLRQESASVSIHLLLQFITPCEEILKEIVPFANTLTCMSTRDLSSRPKRVFKRTAQINPVPL
eukprot:GHVT01069049.1.p1 GENE.GHVT01069049.1~~GHVT01069049.1.p1  ORF type:complete len:333 (+),score=44.83 GHVT01069049.1:1016-2014(+)